jgi:integrase
MNEPEAPFVTLFGGLTNPKKKLAVTVLCGAGGVRCREMVGRLWWTPEPQLLQFQTSSTSGYQLARDLRNDGRMLVHCASCDGNKGHLRWEPYRGFAERRDLAIVRTFLATGARLAEVTALQVGDVDLQARVITITRGKGGKRRVVRIDAGTAAAIDRYRRARSRHRHANLSALWVGQKGALTVSGLDAALHRRADQAGIDGFHAHLLRHWWADAWQSKGGNEGSLQVLGGWADASVMARYGAGRKVDRALAHYDEVNPLGDL